MAWQSVTAGESIGLYDPIKGRFLLKSPPASGAADNSFRYGPVRSRWLAISGDWNGNLEHGPGLYDPATGTFRLRFGLSPGTADRVVTLSNTPTGLIPLAGDWNGDGVDTVGVYDPARGQFVLSDRLVMNAPVTIVRYGPKSAGWKPIVGDWNGDGTDTIGLYDPIIGRFHLRDVNAPGQADLRIRFGRSGANMVPVSGDWNGNGRSTIGLYNGDRGLFQLRNSLSGGIADMSVRFGARGLKWTSLTGSWKPPSGAFSEIGSSPGLLSFEAENYSEQDARGGYAWKQRSWNGASAQRVVQVLPDDTTSLAASLVALGPRLDYRISLLQGGRYHLWVRGTGNGSGSNSVHAGLNGATRSGSIDIALPTTAQPGWSTAGHFVDIVGSGFRTVNLWMHESGAVVDKIVLTRDANFRPVGSGPRQSPRGETNQPPVLSPIGSRTTTQGDTLAFTVQATDADGPPPRIRIEGLPAGATFVDQGNGSGAFNWTTVAGDVGNHTLTFIADDAAAPGSIDSETLVISVLAATGLSAFEQQSARGIAAMEAENYENQTPRSGYAWQLDPSPASGFSGRGAMQVLPDDSVNITSGYAGTSPRLDYPVRFQFTGTHYVWVRGNGPSNAANSVHAGINGQETPSSSGIALPSGDRYGWSNGSHTVQVPSPGVHTVNLWMRESGTIVDKIVLTTDPTFVPTGVGPVESPRGSFNLLPIVENFDDGSAQGWVTVNDTSLSSDWRVVSEGGGNQAYFQFNELGSRTTLDGSYHLGTHSYLSTASALTDFRLRVDLTPLSDAGHDVGVLFRYQSNQAYYRLSFNAAYGFTRLEKRVNGNFTTLARDSRGFRPEQPMEIVVEARGPLIQVFRDGDPIMAVRDGSLGSGSVGLYARGAASFDNLSVVANDTSPRVVISAPLAYSLYPGGPRNLNASAIALSAPAGANVAFELDGQPCNASSQPQSGRFVATCTNAQPGEHVLEAILRTAQFAELDRDTNAAVGVGLEAVGSNHYLALGDSITNGIGDNYAADNISADGRSVGIQGWASVLGERLTDTAGYPNLVSVEATPGDRSDQLLIERLPSILERNPLPNKALILIGTNDSNNSIALPSGAGCNYDQPGGCDNTFKGYLLDIISDLPNAVEAIVSLLPPAFGEGANTGPILNPLNNVQRTQRIRSYNQVIEQEVVTRSGVRLGADLFSCFLRAADGQGPAINHFSLFEDNLHLNGLGQRVMAELLHDALNGAAVQPGNWCPPPLYILQNLSPYTYKQNLLEEGDTYYTDQSYTLTDIPASLTDAIWVMSANADRTSSASSVLSVNLGSAPVTVYVAYDANATVPGWLSTQGFTATSLEVQAAGGSVNRYRLYRSNGRSGLLTLPGNRANGGNGAANYFLAVDP